MNQTNQHQQRDLAPCPFCGSHAQDDFIEGVSYITECYACDASTGRQGSAEAAIAAWNRRADPVLTTPAAGFFVTTGEVTFHPAPAAAPDLDLVVVRFSDLMTLARQIIAEQIDDCDEEFVAGRAHGVGSFHSEILELSKRTALAQAKDETKAAGDAGAAQTRRSGDKAQVESAPSIMADRQFHEVLNECMDAFDGLVPLEPGPSLKALTAYIDSWAARHIGADTLSAMLWLYRRLPRCYGRPPHIEQPIKALAKKVSVNISECLAERGSIEGAGHAQ